MLCWIKLVFSCAFQNVFFLYNSFRWTYQIKSLFESVNAIHIYNQLLLCDVDEFENKLLCNFENEWVLKLNNFQSFANIKTLIKIIIWKIISQWIFPNLIDLYLLNLDAGYSQLELKRVGIGGTSIWYFM